MEPYYVQGGYYYYYHDNRWDYAKSKHGPWHELPRSHWPREIRHKGMDDHGGQGHGYEYEHGHEQRDR